MPQTQLPPTPASSTDIRGKENKLLGLTPALALPPAAYTYSEEAAEDRTATSTPSSHAGSDSSYHPASPALSPPNKTQKKSVSMTTSSSTQARVAKGDDGFALPPPPTRNRKIIQVKPKGSLAVEEEQQQQQQQSTGDVEIPAVTGSSSNASTKATAAGKGKRGKDGNTTAAGRKIARKTAHSLIERRRRSKMNEEFGVLKDMIPACHGQEMHKLAILQASIDYLRYLERCITDLKTANEQGRHTTSPPAAPTTDDIHMNNDQTHLDNETMDHDSDSDEAMSDDGDDANTNDSHSHPSHLNNNNSQTGANTPNTLEPISSRTSLPSLASLPSMSAFAPSPSILPTTTGISHGYTNRHYSISSASQTSSFSPYIHSTHTSPFFGPSYTGSHGGSHNDPGTFSLTSPALKAQEDAQHFRLGSANNSGGNGNGSVNNGGIQHLALSNSNSNSSESSTAAEVRRQQDLDHEATAALLMLNSDRRDWKDKNGRGMSVRDLLS